MPEETVVNAHSSGMQWYEDNIPLRGHEFSLAVIKAALREFAALVRDEGEKIIAAEPRPEGMSDEDFQKRKDSWRKGAFLVTVSIIGFDGQIEISETEDIFDSKQLPLPIKQVFFTNTTAFKRHANGRLPNNHFSVSIHFDKPPLFDPSPLVSHPTENPSQVLISAKDIVYYRAVQTITHKKLKSHKQWYAFLHGTFAYDIGLWFIALPCALYWITVLADRFIPVDGRSASFRVAAFIYGLGLSLIAYRTLFSYFKWAFPVNILEENKDRANWHRAALASVLISIIGASAKSLWSYIFR